MEDVSEVTVAEDIPASAAPNSKTSMHDWVQLFAVPFELLVLTLVGALVLPLFVRLFGLSGIPALIVYLMLLGTLVLCVFGAIWSQARGISFDAEQDRLSFPAYSIRRSVPLSEIRDANSEFVPGGTLFGMIIAAGAAATNGPSRAKPNRMYVVNLSGEFGSRQVRFLSKKRRDQFLSLLHQFAPHIRITRYAAWN